MKHFIVLVAVTGIVLAGVFLLSCEDREAARLKAEAVKLEAEAKLADVQNQAVLSLISGVNTAVFLGFVFAGSCLAAAVFVSLRLIRSRERIEILRMTPEDKRIRLIADTGIRDLLTER